MKHVEPRARWRFSSSSGGGYRFLVPAAAYLVGVAVFFRWQLFSGFDLLSGNSGDTRFIIAIHEHLFQVLHGRGALLSPPFFYDTPGTLGYSDAFILNEALYAPLRLLGAEPFLALLLVPILLSAPAYLFTFLFLRRFGGASVAVATAGALLFTFPNNLYLKSGQVQHFVAYYLPIVLYCATSAIADVHRARVRSCLLSAAAGILCGLVLFHGLLHFLVFRDRSSGFRADLHLAGLARGEELVAGKSAVDSGPRLDFHRKLHCRADPIRPHLPSGDADHRPSFVRGVSGLRAAIHRHFQCRPIQHLLGRVGSSFCT